MMKGKAKTEWTDLAPKHGASGPMTNGKSVIFRNRNGWVANTDLEEKDYIISISCRVPLRDRGVAKRRCEAFEGVLASVQPKIEAIIAKDRPKEKEESVNE